MTPAARRAGETPRVAILRALPGVGDLLCAVPSFRAVRSRYPHGRIVLVGLATSGWFVDRYPDLVDDLLPLEGVEGLPEVVPDPAAAARFARRARAASFDLALQLHGNGAVTNRIMRTLGADRTVGAHRIEDPRPTWPSIVYPDREPEVARMLAVVAAAGCPPRGQHLDLRVTPAERAEADGLLDEVATVGRTFVCVHPGASRSERRWPAERFRDVADHLAERGHTVVVTGTASEADVTSAVADRGRHVDLTGRTSIGVLGAVYQRSALVVTNDTGASHVAAAVRAPSVVVAGGDEPERWAPADHERHRLVARSADRWPSLEEVISVVDAQLARPSAGVHEPGAVPRRRSVLDPPGTG